MPQYTVAAGTPQVIAPPAGRPLSVVAIPGAGGTALVETSNTPQAREAGATGITWVPWAAGAVSATTAQSLTAPCVALRFTATTAGAVFETA